MPEFNYERVATFSEWKKVCDDWRKPNTSPNKKMSSLTDDEIIGKVIACYPDNTDRNERDIVLLKRAGASTPDFDQDYWLSGGNPYLDEQYG